MYHLLPTLYWCIDPQSTQTIARMARPRAHPDSRLSLRRPRFNVSTSSYNVSSIIIIIIICTRRTIPPHLILCIYIPIPPLMQTTRAVLSRGGCLLTYPRRVVAEISPWLSVIIRQHHRWCSAVAHSASTWVYCNWNIIFRWCIKLRAMWCDMRKTCAAAAMWFAHSKLIRFRS